MPSWFGPVKSDKLFAKQQAEADMLALKYNRKLTDAIKNGEPILGSLSLYMPEVWSAMDIASWYGASILGTALRTEEASKYLDASAQMGLGSFMCSLVRVGVYLLEAGLIPKPTMLAVATTGCDAWVMLAQMMMHHKPWAKVPKFNMDAPYGKSDEDMDYFAKQLRELIPFIEKYCGRKLDWDHLREVCEDANKAYQLMWEFQELKRSVPSPVDWPWGSMAFRVARIWAPGQPAATEWMRRLVEAAEKRVKEGKGIDGVTERIRLLWFDVLPIWAYKLFPRLEQEFGAVSVMDMQAFNPPYTIIDTSSEMSMLRSFARRHLNDNPMIRQVMATMDMYCGDIVRIVKDFKIDVVILPLHTGHKDINAAAKIVSDLCRDIGVPFLSLGCDLFDEQYMTVDEVMEKISRFFHAMGLA